MRLFPHTNRSYLTALADHVVVFDGAMGTSVQACHLGPIDFGGETLNGCNDYLVITRPDVVESIHASFLEAGAEVIETDTFRSNRITLREYGLQDRIVEINRAAASVARGSADRFALDTGLPRFVAGSIGPSGLLPSTADPTLSNISFQKLVDVFREQCLGLIQGGVGLLLASCCSTASNFPAKTHEPPFPAFPACRHGRPRGPAERPVHRGGRPAAATRLLRRDLHGHPAH